MPDAGSAQYVVGSPEWKAFEAEALRRDIALKVEAAYKEERRAFIAACKWLGTGVLSAAFLVGYRFAEETWGYAADAGHFFDNDALLWLNDAVGILCFCAVVASILVTFSSPFAFIWSLFVWIKAIGARRRAAYPRYHPDLDSRRVS